MKELHKKEIVLWVVFAQLACQQSDRMGFSKVYKQQLKLYLKRFINSGKMLEKLLAPAVDHLFIKRKGDDDEKQDIDNAFEQLVDNCSLYWKYCLALMSVEEIHATGFENDAKLFFKKYGVDLEEIENYYENETN